MGVEKVCKSCVVFVMEKGLNNGKDDMGGTNAHCPSFPLSCAVYTRLGEMLTCIHTEMMQGF